jgi:hypothetical protein
MDTVELTFSTLKRLKIYSGNFMGQVGRYIVYILTYFYFIFLCRSD